MVKISGWSVQAFLSYLPETIPTEENKMAATVAILDLTAAKINRVPLTSMMDLWLKFQDDPFRRSWVIVRKPSRRKKKTKWSPTWPSWIWHRRKSIGFLWQVWWTRRSWVIVLPGGKKKKKKKKIGQNHKGISLSKRNALMMAILDFKMADIFT